MGADCYFHKFVRGGRNAVSSFPEGGLECSRLQRRRDSRTCSANSGSCVRVCTHQSCTRVQRTARAAMPAPCPRVLPYPLVTSYMWGTCKQSGGQSCTQAVRARVCVPRCARSFPIVQCPSRHFTSEAFCERSLPMHSDTMDCRVWYLYGATRSYAARVPSPVLNVRAVRRRVS